MGLRRCYSPSTQTNSPRLCTSAVPPCLKVALVSPTQGTWLARPSHEKQSTNPDA